MTFSCPGAQDQLFRLCLAVIGLLVVAFFLRLSQPSFPPSTLPIKILTSCSSFCGYPVLYSVAALLLLRTLPPLRYTVNRFSFSSGLGQHLEQFSSVF